MNLTRVGAEAGESVDRNYLDSLAPLAQGLLQGAKAALDVGSGAGFPGQLCITDRRGFAYCCCNTRCRLPWKR